MWKSIGLALECSVLGWRDLKVANGANVACRHYWNVQKIGNKKSCGQIGYVLTLWIYLSAKQSVKMGLVVVLKKIVQNNNIRKNTIWELFEGLSESNIKM